jgi:hypothetical protein
MATERLILEQEFHWAEKSANESTGLLQQTSFAFLGNNEYNGIAYAICRVCKTLLCN